MISLSDIKILGFDASGDSPVRPCRCVRQIAETSGDELEEIVNIVPV